jgi:hypothetical protein
VNIAAATTIISIYEPETLKNDAQVLHANKIPVGLFFSGHASNDAVMQAEVIMNKMDFSGCHHYMNKVRGKIVIVTSFECSTRTKVLRAQEGGAVGVIIVSSYQSYQVDQLHNEFDEEDSDGGWFGDSEYTDEEIINPKIPCFVIERNLGNSIINSASNRQTIQVRIDFDDVRIETMVNVEIWTSS